MEEIQVRGLMNRSVVTAKVDSTLTEIVHLMSDNKISCVVVVAKRKPIGIVTERDLVRILQKVLDDNCSYDIIAKDFMTDSPIIVEQDTVLFDALVLTQSNSIRHLPVVGEDGELCGILSYSDLAQAYEHVIEQQRDVIEHELSFETRRLREVNEQLKSLSMEDALLHVGNRRSMEVDLCYTHSMALRYQRPYSVILFDVDCFKQYNDFYGHKKGDEALKAITDYIRGAIRKSDRLYRYGGEELLLLLPETGAEGANIMAERTVKELAELSFPHEKSQFGVLTMSGGVATVEEFENHNPDWHSVVEEADKKLYQAKQSGRNRICAASLDHATELPRAAGQT